MSGANIDNEVYIVGGGMTEFGRFDGEDQELAEQAMRDALADCNITWADVDFAVGGTNGDSLVSLGAIQSPITAENFLTEL